MYAVEEYLDACLDSIRGQSHTALEVIVVDDGSPDDSRKIAERHAASDERIKVVSQANAGLGAARNTAVKHATGQYLTFVDSDDELPDGSIEAMVRSAESNRADMVVGNLARFDSKREWLSAWSFAIHDRDRPGIRAVDFPDIVRNNYTPGKLYRTSFWRSCGLWFREGVSYEDQPIITQLLSRAGTLNVLSRVLYMYRRRDDASSISQQTHTLTDLRARIAAWDTSHEVLSAEAPGAVYDAWMKTIYETHFHWYLRSPSIDNDAFWAELRDAVVRLSDLAPATVVDSAVPTFRVAVEFARRGQRDALREFVRRGGYNLAAWPATTRPDGGLAVELPYYQDPATAIPDACFTLPAERLDLLHRIDHARWNADGSLWVNGYAYFRLVDLDRERTSISLTIRNTRTGTTTVVPTRHDPEPLMLSSGDIWAEYEAAGFEATLPLGELATAPGATDDDGWEMLLTVQTGSIGRTVTVDRITPGGSVRHLGPGSVPDGFLCSPELEDRRPFRIEQVRPSVFLEDAELRGRDVRGRLVAPQGAEVHRVFLADEKSGIGASSDRAEGPDHRFTLTVPEGPAPPGLGATVWRLRAELTTGKTVPVASQDVALETRRSAVAPATPSDHRVTQLRRTRRGNVQVTESAFRVEIDELRFEDGHLLVGGSAVGAGPDPRVSLYVRSATAQSTPAEADLHDQGRFTATVPLTRTMWRFGELQMPAGTYTLHFSRTNGDDEVVEGPAEMSTALTERTPIRYDGERLAGTVIRAAPRAVRINLVPPQGPRARGRYRQNRLKTRTGTGDGRLEGVLLQSNFGEIAGCNSAAVHAELRRRGAEVPIYWTVKDHSVFVPDGATPVIRNSSRWYELLRSARYVVDNMYQPDFHRRPDGQVIVQTFHGYPFKVMGHTHWRALRLSQDRIDSYDERAAEWSYLVSPARYATELLRRDFAYDGEVLEIGYPRNDVLQSPRAPAIRDEVRRSLGIGPRATAVLYAPTFRDYLSPDDRTAEMVDFLDFEAFAAGVGPDTVLLTRGHAFNARDRNRAQVPDSVIDVTDYPDPADLYLATDVAVVDYSSLRFDFAVTGKPMLFLVPDLERYRQTRGWVVDFEATAPGPFLTSTSDVVDAVRDLEAVAAAHREEYERFRASFLDLEDGRASAQLVDEVFVPRGDAPASD